MTFEQDFSKSILSRQFIIFFTIFPKLKIVYDVCYFCDSYGRICSDDYYDVNTTKMFLRVLHPYFVRRACNSLGVSRRLSESASVLASRFAFQ